ncbi:MULTISPECIES: GntR family transcriptional regulator [unclassified Virgibacillus]|uniref:GntR family transcriptional regulator n=1 Tax=unclassified Virgibacillus TaxID=2620237 RepID=UPI0024DEDADA|nr:GntR family transcriptional regulator [Virgibacillus sp. LDC-1]
MPIPSNSAKLIRKSAKENVLMQLQQWIIDGTLTPGEKINDKELAEALGVSRTPVREALQLLEVQGFVKMYPGKATQVTEVDKESINELLPPLAALQSMSAELAIPELTDIQIFQLEQTNHRFAEAIRTENYFTALKIDEEFHQMIVDAANNTYIHKIIDSLQAHVRRLFFHNSIILTEKSVQDHVHIINYIKEKDRTKASLAMRENWLRAIEEFQSFNKA